MARYRNDGSMPLNYGDKGPWVNPGETFDEADYPELPRDQVASHLQSGFISVVDGFKALAESLADIREDDARELSEKLRRRDEE